MKNTFLQLLIIILTFSGCNTPGGNNYYYFINNTDFDIKFKLHTTSYLGSISFSSDSIVKSMDEILICQISGIGWCASYIDSVSLYCEKDTIKWFIGNDIYKYIPFWDQLKWQVTRDKNYNWHYYLDFDNSLFGDSYYYFYNKTNNNIYFKVYSYNEHFLKVNSDSLILNNDSILILKSDEPYWALGYIDSVKIFNNRDTTIWELKYIKNPKLNVYSPQSFYQIAKWRENWDSEKNRTNYCLVIDSIMFEEY